MASVMREFLDNSYLFGANAPFIEELYEQYLVNPASVPDEWRDYFDRLQQVPGSIAKDVAHAPVYLLEELVFGHGRGRQSCSILLQTRLARDALLWCYTLFFMHHNGAIRAKLHV